MCLGCGFNLVAQYPAFDAEQGKLSDNAHLYPLWLSSRFTGRPPKCDAVRQYLGRSGGVLAVRAGNYSARPT